MIYLDVAGAQVIDGEGGWVAVEVDLRLIPEGCGPLDVQAHRGAGEQFKYCPLVLNREIHLAQNGDVAVKLDKVLPVNPERVAVDVAADNRRTPARVDDLIDQRRQTHRLGEHRHG